MRTNITRTVHLLVSLALFTAGTGAVAGCGSGSGSGSGSEGRARQVADAWDGSQAAEVWRSGYYPMGEAVQLPEGGLRNKDDQRAYTTQNFVLRGELPATSHEDGEVRWEGGRSLTLPLMGARTAYETVATGGNDGPHLTVTGAKLGEMNLATNRGPATVPAWQFTLEGYDTPLKRVAVSPSKLPQPPIKPARDVSASELAPLRRLVEVTEDGRTVTVMAGHGTCDDGPAVDVLETGGSVVLSASVVGIKDGPCTDMLVNKEVTVKLDRPVGDRVLLDAFTGRPVPYGESHGRSPSWS